MWKVSASVVPADLERARRALIATPDRRGRERETLDGVADVSFGGRRARSVTIDLAEGGFSLLCPIEPAVGEAMEIEVAGLVVQGRVRHVARDGAAFRVGVEAA